VLPALPQRGRDVGGWRTEAPGVGVLVREELACHVQPGHPHPGALRNARRPEGRRVLPGGMRRKASGCRHQGKT
jgi:hypothetical protein